MKAPPHAELKAALNTMILSPSGWRGIFAASGDEEDRGAAINPAMGIVAAAGAVVFTGYLRNRKAPDGPSADRPLCVLLGTDTRPTGKAAADFMIRAFLGMGLEVRYTGVSAAPEIMALSKKTGAPFAYVSASHNPIGHNGIKFGTDGGVLEGGDAVKLAAALKEYLDADGAGEAVLALAGRADEDKLRRVYEIAAEVKTEALSAYRSFIAVVAGGEKTEPNLFDALARGLAARPLGIACDFNGSARAASVDEELFRSLGIGFRAMNAEPGGIAHAIIPEGASLEPCRAFLERLHAEDPAFTLGYVPDCDGDRGNLVVWDERAGRARILEAQEVFALACAAELAYMAYDGELSRGTDGRPRKKAAVAVNGPTSMRIDRIAEAFGVTVFRAEVGEANVVNLARRLREEGYAVRILGEGSNGGCIIHPSAVRDPLSTLLALIKFLTIRDGGAEGKGLFALWNERALAGKSAAGRSAFGPDFTITDIIDSLPRFFTTGVSAPEARLRAAVGDQRLFKQNYEAVFRKQWETKKAGLASRGIESWEARACVGTGEKRNLASFADAETGGLKIVFSGGGRERAFIWMRGSKTEPVFRIMADAEDAGLERELTAWQGAMAQEAAER